MALTTNTTEYWALIDIESGNLLATNGKPAFYSRLPVASRRAKSLNISGHPTKVVKVGVKVLE